MVGSSKILTVSYGTFSCTLEGFDDSFDTMKAIAEYFRDLAADDRYFGAEPPTPDAEMLARIAEREISRRVEAHEQQGRIVLRADDASPEPETAPEDDAARREETAQTAPDVPQTATGLLATGQEDLPEPETKNAGPDSETVPYASDGAPEPASGTAEPGQDAPEVLQDEARVPLAADPDSFAAKLHLIRSVANGDAPSAADQYSEDEHAQDFVRSGTADAALWPEDYEDDTAEEVSAASPGPAAQVGTEEQGQDTFQDTLAALMADADPDASTSAEPAPGVSARDEAMSEDDPATQPAPEAEDGTEAEDAASAEPDAVADAEQAVTPEDTPLEEAPVSEEETASADAASGGIYVEGSNPDSRSGADTPETLTQIARVVKVRRTELEETIEQDLFEEEAQDTSSADDAAPENMFGENAALSPEEEAELQRELAELEAEFDPAEAEQNSNVSAEPADDGIAPAEARSAEPVAPVEQPAEDTAQGRRKLARAEAEDDLSRIFEETDTHLEAPASSQRRNTIQHLRAALEATRAEKAAGSKLEPDIDEAAYRSDLADVVRPRRPQALTSETRSARPVEARPAPLKLVAEQRVDTDRAPIRPRRVSSADIQTGAETAQNGGFTAFAEEMGARALPDLLEAAAAYLADVEGRPQFSRPMLMGKLKEIEQEGFSREDGLRSFGKLLRDGKLQKLSGGRFAVTEETDFRTQDKRQVG